VRRIELAYEERQNKVIAKRQVLNEESNMATASPPQDEMRV